MQPATQPGLDCAEDFGQLGSARRLALRRAGLPQGELRAGFPFRRQATTGTGEVTCSQGRGLPAATPKVGRVWM